MLAVASGWVISWATFVCVTYQIHTGPWLGFGATLVIDLAVAVGVWRAAPEHLLAWVVGLAWLLLAAALCRWMWVLVLRGGRLADAAAEMTARLRREREVATAVRADEQRAARMLHDTASTTRRPLALHYDGKAWTEIVAPATTGQFHDLEFVAGRTVAIGGVPWSDEPLMAGLAGKEFVQTTTPSGSGYLHGSVRVGKCLWAVGSADPGSRFEQPFIAAGSPHPNAGHRRSGTVC